MIILGIDPGNARCGYGVIEKEGARTSFVSCGCIETPKSIPQAERLSELHKKLSELLVKFKPDEAAVEELFYFKNPATVIRVAEARGVVLAALSYANVPAFSYTPLQVKQAVSAYGRAGKAQVGKMVAKILRLEKPPSPDDAADALAAALCHAATMRM